jgi:hypothetical protein
LGDDSGLPQPEWERRGWKLFRKAAERAPETHQWQSGDTVANRENMPFGISYSVVRLDCGRIALAGLSGKLSQADWEKRGFRLHSKASDSTSTDGEGQP